MTSLSEWTAWAETRDEVLERLSKKARAYEFYGFREQLVELCAAVLARAGQGRIVFVGRSPENVYDLLSALLTEVRGAPRLDLLPFSFRDWSPRDPRRLEADEQDGSRRHLRSLALDPASILAGEAVSFVDCVCWGTTLGNLEELLRAFARDEGVDEETVMKRVRYLGLVPRSVGWDHWRQDSESGGQRLFRQGRAGVIPISKRLWNELAWLGDKTTESYTRSRWSRPPRLPALDKERARAIARAVDLRVMGLAREARRDFARKLARRAVKGQRWLHKLIAAILRRTQPRKS